MITYINKLKRFGVELDVPVELTEEWKDSNQTHLLKLKVGKHKFVSEKRHCDTNEEVANNYEYLMDMFIKSVVEKYGKE